MFSMGAASWFSHEYGLALLYPLVIVLGVMGILAFVQERGLDSIVFFAGATLLGLAGAYSGMLSMGKAAEPASFLGWFAILWAVFFCYIWAGSLKSGTSRMLFLLGAWITMLALAIGCWTGVSGFLMAGGYLGLITSIFAVITSASEVFRLGTSTGTSPSMGTSAGTATGTGHAQTMAAD
jgi:hypothetical protein